MEPYEGVDFYDIESLLTEEEIMIRDMVRDWVDEEVLPKIEHACAEGVFLDEWRVALGEMGVLGAPLKGYGCPGLSYVAYGLICQELERGDSGLRSFASVQGSLAMYPIWDFGSEEQKNHYLPKMTSGEWIGCFGLTEPDYGSNPGDMITKAEDMGDHYLLNGTKNWITNGGSASTYLVIAQTDADKGHRGINCLIVERSMEGFMVGAKEDKMGIRGSDTHTLMFQDVKVPKANRLGEDGFGFKFAMKTLAGGRIGIAAQALGIASGSLEFALAYSKERKAFGKEIHKHQAIAFKLADMATEVEAARMLCLKAAGLKDQGQDYDLASSMAKLYASEVAGRASDQAVQIHGGYGFVKEYHVERLMRDSKITQIYEGTSEVQRIVISRAILQG